MNKKALRGALVNGKRGGHAGQSPELTLEVYRQFIR